MQLSDRNRLFRGAAMAVAALLLVAGAVFGSQAVTNSQHKIDATGSQNGSVESNNANETEIAEPSETEIAEPSETEVNDVNTAETHDATDGAEASQSEVEHADGSAGASESPDESHSDSGGGDH